MEAFSLVTAVKASVLMKSASLFCGKGTVTVFPSDKGKPVPLKNGRVVFKFSDCTAWGSKSALKRMEEGCLTFSSKSMLVWDPSTNRDEYSELEVSVKITEKQALIKLSPRSSSYELPKWLEAGKVFCAHYWDSELGYLPVSISTLAGLPEIFLGVDLLGVVKALGPETVGIDSRVMRNIKKLIVFINSLEVKYSGGKRTLLKKSYRHWPVPKSSKKGYRLISAPSPSYKKYTDKVLALFSDCRIEEIKHGGEVLSYTKGVDYVKSLAGRDLSVKTLGRWMFSVDYSDYFTKLSPELLTDCIYSIMEKVKAEDTPGKIPYLVEDPILRTSEDLYSLHKYPMADKIVEAWMSGAEHSILPSKFLYDKILEIRYGDPALSPALKLQYVLAALSSSLFTTRLPLWKTSLAGIDIIGGTGKKDPLGYQKYASHLRTSIFKKDIDLYSMHKEKSYRPWSRRGVPQGAAFSGKVANWVSEIIAEQVVREMNKLLKSFDGNVTHCIIYSDNLYVFYDSPTGAEGILKRHIPNVVGWATGVDTMAYAGKMSVTDRNKYDAKILGVIVDSEGDLRLSRQTRRYLNQKLIHARRDSRNLSIDEVGKIVWYNRIKVLGGGMGKYSRELFPTAEAG